MMPKIIERKKGTNNYKIFHELNVIHEQIGGI
jgi:hypothetical protein